MIKERFEEIKEDRKLLLWDLEKYDWLISEVERLQFNCNEHEKVLKLTQKDLNESRKTLKFYADKDNYEAWEEHENATGFFNNIDFDGGDKARQILETEEKA